MVSFSPAPPENEEIQKQRLLDLQKRSNALSRLRQPRTAPPTNVGELTACVSASQHHDRVCGMKNTGQMPRGKFDASAQESLDESRDVLYSSLHSTIKQMTREPFVNESQLKLYARLKRYFDCLDDAL